MSFKPIRRFPVRLLDGTKKWFFPFYGDDGRIVWRWPYRQPIVEENGIPAWVPEGALTWADPKAGIYYINGAPVTIDDFFEENADWDSEWDPAAAVDGVGLIAESTGMEADVIVAPVLTAAARAGFMPADGGFTVVLIARMSAENEPLFGEVSIALEWFDAPDFNVGWTFGASYRVNRLSAARIGDYAESPVDLDPPGNGLAKFAFTITPTKLVGSVNGGAVTVGGAPTDASAANTIGLRIRTQKVVAESDAIMSVIVEGLAFLPPQDDADLPALSALPVPDWLEEFPAPGDTPPVVAFDFVGQNWWAGDEDQLLEDVISLGSAFLTPSGLEFINGAEATEIIGQAFDDLHARLAGGGATIYLEFVKNSEPPAEVINLFKGDFDWEYRLYLNQDLPMWEFRVTDYDFVSLSAFSPEEIFETGDPVKMAITIDRDIGGGMYRHAASMNGSTALTDDVNYTQLLRIAGGVFDHFLLASYEPTPEGAGGGMIIQKLAIYGAVTEAELEGMTSP